MKLIGILQKILLLGKSLVQRLGKELIIVGIGQALAALGGIVGVRLMTGVVSPDIYGQISLAITIVTLSNQILIGPFSASLSRYFAFAQEKDELHSYIGSGLKLTVWITLGICLLFVVGMVYLVSIRQPGYAYLAFFILLFTLISGYNVFLDSIQSAARQRVVVAWHQSAAQWLRYLVAASFLTWFGKSAGTAMAGYGIAALLVLGSQMFFFVRFMPRYAFKKIHADSVWTNRMIRYSAPFCTWGIFT
jgi:O-antigen/teichoic acid export membrane protein